MLCARWPLCRGIDLSITANLSPAAGLSSSSALLTGVALALLKVNGISPSTSDLMELLPEGEQYVGTRGGGMDHAAVLASQAGHALFVHFNPISFRTHSHSNRLGLHRRTQPDSRREIGSVESRIQPPPHRRSLRPCQIGLSVVLRCVAGRCLTRRRSRLHPRRTQRLCPRHLGSPPGGSRRPSLVAGRSRDFRRDSHRLPRQSARPAPRQQSRP